mgnify:CR=1 FL=1
MSVNAIQFLYRRLEMMKLQIPYNKIQMNIEIPDANFQGVLESHPADCVMEGTEQEIVERALDNAICQVLLLPLQ